MFVLSSSCPHLLPPPVCLLCHRRGRRSTRVFFTLSPHCSGSWLGSPSSYPWDSTSLSSKCSSHRQCMPFWFHGALQCLLVLLGLALDWNLLPSHVRSSTMLFSLSISCQVLTKCFRYVVAGRHTRDAHRDCPKWCSCSPPDDGVWLFFRLACLATSWRPHVGPPFMKLAAEAWP